MIAAFKILTKTAPAYLLKLATDITKHMGRNIHQLFLPSVRIKNSFYFQAAVLWNNLDTKLYSASSLYTFKLLYIFWLNSVTNFM